MNGDGHLSIRAAAELLGVSVVTLRRWDKDGTLVPQGRGRGGVRTYRREDVARVLAARSRSTGADATRPLGDVRTPPTSFVGRVSELADLVRLFDRGARVVTIVGPPGVGKTRLAVEHALTHGHAACFADLSGASTLDQLCAALERDLGLGGAPQRSTEGAVGQLAAALSRRATMLLVLDNLEQMTNVAAPFVARVTRDVPGLRVLATSRERLRIAAETVLDLSPLDVATDGVALFVARAAGRCDESDPAVRALVRRLDGIPLAIELAAARLGVLSPKDLLERLGDHLSVLGEGPRDATARQATLRGAIEWSWRLLRPVEQSALAQCSVFRGGLSVDAAEHVIDLTAFPDAPPLVDVLAALHDKSLLRSDDFPALKERRLSLLVSIAEYAAQKLAALGLEDHAFERHARFFVERGRAWSDACEGPNEHPAMLRLAVEESNILAVHARAAARAASSKDAAARSIEAVTLLEPMLWRRGCLDAHYAALERAVTLARETQVGPALTAVALRSVGRARIWRGDPEGAEAAALEGVALARGNPGLEASLRRVASTSLHRRGKRADAVREAERALALDETAGDRRWQGVDAMLVGGLLLDEGAPRARALLERAHLLLRELGRPTHAGIARMYLGMFHHDKGRLDDALREMRGATELLSGDPRRVGYTLGLAASVMHEQLRLDAAIAEYARALAILVDAPWPPDDAILRARYGAALADAGEDARAEEELARADAMARGATGWILPALALHRGHLDVARYGRARNPADAANAERRLAECAPPHADYELRLAYRWLEAAVARSRAPMHGANALVIGADGQWFRVPGASRVDIAHRRPLCLILACLAEEHARSGGGVPVDRLVERGWPGERVLAAAGAKRVRVAIATLREFGLRELLVRQPDGYALAPSARVRIER